MPLSSRNNLRLAVGTVSNGDSANINRPNDVRSVQEVLSKLGHYKGEIGAPVDPNDSNDATIKAIRKFQGRNADGRIDPGGATERRLNAEIDKNTSPKYSSAENERNGATGDRGRHVYYNGETEGARSGHFRIKGAPWSAVIEPNTTLTKEQIRSRLIPGANPQE